MRPAPTAVEPEATGTPPAGPGTPRDGYAASVLAATVAGLGICTIASVRRGHLAIPDDVYFYLKIADAIYQGEGSTFNGLHLTNGYHPLWMLVCVVERAVAGSGADTRLAAHLAVSGSLTLLATLMAWRMSGRLLTGRVGLAAALFGIFLARNHLGSELHASAPLMVASAAWVLRMQKDVRRVDVRDDLILGALLGLTTLARLDNVFVGVALGTAASLPRHGESWKDASARAARVAGSAGLLLAPYLGWNLTTFDHLIPISGAIKAGLARHRPEALTPMGAQGALLVLGSLFSVGFWLRAAPSRSRPLMRALSLGSAAHGAYTAVFAHAVWTWYFVGEALTVSLTLEAVALGCASLLSPRAAPWVPRAVAAASVLLVFGVTYEVARRGSHGAWYLEAADWVDSEVPEGGAIAVAQSPGSIAYFSSRPIVALDGLTGDFAWHEQAKEHGLHEALRKLGVTHLLAMGPASKELGTRIQRTRTFGHGGEAPAFEGRLLPDGTGRLRRVGLFDPIVGRHVGWLRADDGNLQAQVDQTRALGLWRLQPAPNRDALQ